MTVEETSRFLEKKRTWVYNSIPKISSYSISANRGILSGAVIYRLFLYSMKARSLNKVNYDMIAEPSYLSKVNSEYMVKLVKDAKSVEELCEIAFAKKAWDVQCTISNILVYMERCLVRKDIRIQFEDYLLKKAYRLFAEGKLSFDFFNHLPINKLEQEMVHFIRLQLL